MEYFALFDGTYGNDAELTSSLLGIPLTAEAIDCAASAGLIPQATQTVNATDEAFDVAA